jgi:hypothetical protein
VVAAFRFWITDKMVFSGTITGSQTAATITASAAIFESYMVNWYVRFDDGSLGKITAYTNPTTVTVDTNQSVASQSFRLVPATFVMTTSGAFFDDEMEGLRLLGDDGPVRKITDVVSSTIALTDSDLAVSAQLFGLENPDAYKPVASDVATTRIQYRVLWSMAMDDPSPRRFGAIVLGSMTAGDTKVTLQWPSKCFEAGMEIRVVGAGASEGNLTANVISVSGIGTVLHLDAPAQTTVTEGAVQATDSVGAGAASEDLQGDGSGIIRMLPLRAETLVVYKDSQIFLGRYYGGDGETDPVFTFRQVAERTEKSLYYRWTVIEVNELYHVYAGRNAFYKFDLTNQVPEEIPLAEAVSDLFFDHANLDDDDRIYAAFNALTSEVMWFLPSEDTDQSIVVDTISQTVSTSDEYLSAAASVKRPLSGIELINEDWFLFGTEDGQVLQYGLVTGHDLKSGAITATQAGAVVTASAAIFTKEHIGRTIQYSDGTLVAVTGWTSTTKVTVNVSQTKATGMTFTVLPAIWHRDGEEYDSVLQGGLLDFGDPNSEKAFAGYVLLLAGQSPHTEVNVSFQGCRSPSEGASVLASTTITPPETMVPLYLMQNYIQDKLTVSGHNNPIRLVGRVFQVRGVNTMSFNRVTDSQ